MANRRSPQCDCKRSPSPVRRSPGPRCAALLPGRVDLIHADTDSAHQVNLSTLALHDDMDYVRQPETNTDLTAVLITLEGKTFPGNFRFVSKRFGSNARISLKPTALRASWSSSRLYLGVWMCLLRESSHRWPRFHLKHWRISPCGRQGAAILCLPILRVSSCRKLLTPLSCGPMTERLADTLPERYPERNPDTWRQQKAA